MNARHMSCEVMQVEYLILLFWVCNPMHWILIKKNIMLNCRHLILLKGVFIIYIDSKDTSRQGYQEDIPTANISQNEQS